MESGELTIKEAAEISGYSRAYLAELLEKEKLQGRKIGPMWLVKEESLRAYMAQPHKPGPKGPKKKNSEDEPHNSLGKGAE